MKWTLALRTFEWSSHGSIGLFNSSWGKVWHPTLFWSISEGSVSVSGLKITPHSKSSLCLFPSVFFFHCTAPFSMFSYVFLSSLAPFLSRALRSALWDMLLIFHLEWSRAVQHHCNINSFLPSLASLCLTQCSKPPQLSQLLLFHTN